MQYLFMAIFAAAIVAADQFTKYLVLQNIPLHGHVDFIPGLLSFTYVRNTGAAFSSFEGAQWLFVVVFVLFTAAIVWEFSGKRWPFTTFERWLIVAVYGGGIGNMIDRFRFGYVVDMIQTDFMDFPVFNIADIAITCGAALLVIYFIFFDKDEKNGENNTSDIKS